MSCFLEVLQGSLWVEREMELVAPAELETRLRQRIVANGSTWMALRQVGCMSGNLVGDDTCAYIFFIRQGQMLLGSYVAQHGGTKPGYLCATYSTCNMVVARSNIGNNRPQRVERCLVALIKLALHILTYLMHRRMSGALNECLHILIPRPKHKLAHRVELGKLGCIVGIGSTSGAQTVAKTQGHIVTCHYIADVIEMLIKETLPVVYQAPFAHDTSATTHDTT